MDDELLRSVIELERQLQQQLAVEQRRAATWLEREQQLQQDRLQAGRKELASAARRRFETAERRLQRRIDAWEAAELARLERFQHYVDRHLEEELQGLLMDFVAGSGHDHQDVESGNCRPQGEVAGGS